MCRALRQLQMPVPADLPFKDYLPLVQNDNTVDPFDATEMIGVIADSSSDAAGTAAPAASTRHRTPDRQGQVSKTAGTPQALAHAAIPSAVEQTRSPGLASPPRGFFFRDAIGQTSQ